MPARPNKRRRTWEEIKASTEDLCKVMKEVLGRQGREGPVSRRSRLPCVLVTGEYGWSANMERIMKAQALRDSSTSRRTSVERRRARVLPDHQVAARQGRADQSDKTVKDLIWLSTTRGALVPPRASRER